MQEKTIRTESYTEGMCETHSRWMASNTINIEINMRKIPFANPDNVSIRP